MRSSHVVVAKYADHLPLYQQAQIFARQNVQLARSTLADWVGRAAWWLTPLRDHLLGQLKRSSRLLADETTAPVLDPGRGRTKTGQLWAYPRDDRPWGGVDPPAVAYVYAPDRKAERPIEHLAGFRGVLQAMVMPATARSPDAATSRWPSAGRMSGGASTSSPPPVPHRRQRRR